MVAPPPSAARGLFGQVVDALGGDIGRGELQPGDRIVPEDVGERFGVSQSVTREAVRVLASKGMVVARPRVGTLVQSADRWNLLDRDVIRWRVEGPGRDDHLRDLVALRLAIEPAAARAAATRRSRTELDRMRRACEQMHQALDDDDRDGFTEADAVFHTSLLAASGNLVFEQLMGAVDAVLHARQTLHLLPDQLGFGVVAAHRAITDYIEREDADGAEAACVRLISAAGAEIVAALTGDSASAGVLSEPRKELR